jgi:hypothetical protein
VGFCLAVFFHYALGVYAGKGYPYNTFLFVPVDRFSDFYRVVEANQNLNPFFGPHHMYQYPLLNFFGFLFSLMPLQFAIVVYIYIIAGFMIMACSYFIRLGTRPTNWKDVFILSFLTSPFLYVLDRCNFDGFMFIFLTIFIYFFMNEKYLLSAFFLSLAIAMKPFPAVFLLLFVAEKKYRDAILTVASTVIITAIILFFFKGGFVANLLATISISSFPDVIGESGYFSANNFVFHSMSVFTMLKVYFIETGAIQNIDMAVFSSLYVKIMAALLIPISLYVIFVEKELWKRAAILSIIMVIFPQISGTYRLMYMFVPLFLFLKNEVPAKNDYLYTVLFGLLLIPKNYYYLPNTVTDGNAVDFSIGYPINFFAMLLILLLIITTGMLKFKDGLEKRGA